MEADSKEPASVLLEGLCMRLCGVVFWVVRLSAVWGLGSAV